MNKENLNKLIAGYIEKFEYINNSENDENYKWVIAAQFRNKMDALVNGKDADLPAGIASLCTFTSNLIDNATMHAFSALGIFAKQDARAVKEALRTLLADDNQDFSARRKKIESFILQCGELMQKYTPGNWRYVMDTRTAMAILALYDPDHYYLYKSTQAHEFADCVGFYDEWGSEKDFNQAVYYRMCDTLVEALREDKALMEVHQSRFENAKEPMHPDEALHLLAFDIIYSGIAYGLYSGMDYSHATSAEKKLYLQRREEAQKRLVAYQQAEEDAAKLAEAEAAFTKLTAPGAKVQSKAFGCGTVESQANGFISVDFGKNSTKFFDTIPSLANGFLMVDGAESMLEAYHDVMQRAKTIPDRLRAAEEALATYSEYLE